MMASDYLSARDNCWRRGRQSLVPAVFSIASTLITTPVLAQDSADCVSIQDPVWFCAPISDWMPFDDQQQDTPASYNSLGIYAQVFVDPGGRDSGMSQEDMIRAIFDNLRSALPDGEIEIVVDEPDEVDGLPGKLLVLRMTEGERTANFAITIVVTDTHTMRFSTMIEVVPVTDFRLQRHDDFLSALRIGNPDG